MIQDDENPHVWRNILSVTFNSLGSGSIPNNTLTFIANSNYDSKTLTDLNNDFVDSLSLFNTENIINKIMDIIYGSISSTIGKSLKQLENEARINTVIDKMVDNVNKNPIDDSNFSFSKEETLAHQSIAANRKKGLTTLNTSNPYPSSIPVNNLTNLTQDLSTTTDTIQKKNVITTHLNTLANASVTQIPNKTDLSSTKLNFIQQIIDNLIKSVVSTILSPKVIVLFIINYKIVYGPTATYGDGVDFIKKNKILMTAIMKTIAEELIKILLAIALKEISILVASSIAKKEKEKSTNRLTQILSLVGVPTDTIKKLLDNLI